MLHTIVTGASGLDGRVSSLTSMAQVGVTTLRNRTTIGSSFRSSFSLAATSMEYARKTDFTSAACTEIYCDNVSSWEINHHFTRHCRASQIHADYSMYTMRKTHLRFPHNLAPRTDPRNEDEFLALRLLVVRVSDTDIGVGGLGGIQFLL